ncbi:glycoside hydrolase family 104 protein [Synechococcus sp. HK01-R]|uniref:glycoside hydrolase family 24 protein n=1 Tax=Synechococcus sp. HK01-R TaxID=2751171 RepID=UPI001626066B|nr:glycoside hydrolase family 104 protein [Synechococcus sp. HK01-R]QNG26658.1 glycoside hydrolase family 104 protein [Synechococcus sp. HK01-R]
MASLVSSACRVVAAVVASVPIGVSFSPARASTVALPSIEPSARSLSVTLPEESGPSALPYVITPERRALLNTIRFAEGTWKGGRDLGYRVMFGGGLMASLDRHPNRVIYSSRYASAAAGAYQFMPFTWDLVKRSIGVQGFGPEAQDQGALFLIQRRKALPLTDAGVMTPQLAALLAPEWASFPTLRGSSYYGQPVKRFSQLQRFYRVTLAQLRQVRDQRRELLSSQSKPQTEQDSGPKRPVCTGPTILCGF